MSDSPPVTDEALAQARPDPAGLPLALAEAFRTRVGRPRAADKAVSLRVPPDLLAAFKAEDPGCQTRMNEVLAVAR